MQAAGSAGSRSDNQHHSPQQLSKQHIEPWPLLPTCCDRCLLVIDINNQTETATWWNNLWLQTDALDIKRSCTTETARVHHSVAAGAQELYMGLVVPSSDANLQHEGMCSQRSEVVYKQCRSICNSTPSAGTEQQRLVLNMHAPSPPAGLAHELQSAHETQQSKHQLQQSQIRGRFGTGRCMTWPSCCPLDPMYVASI